MRKTSFIQLRSILLTVCLAVIMFPVPVAATQGHSGVEGVHVHQLAHLFFIFSMGTLIYWIRKRELVREKGWRYIQYSALFFILWNIDAFAVHFLDEQIHAVVVSQGDPFAYSNIHRQRGSNGSDISIIWPSWTICSVFLP